MSRSKRYRALRLAAIDVGSNAIRLLINDTTPNGSLTEVFSKRFSLRLGKDAFSSNFIHRETMRSMMSVFGEIRAFLDAYNVNQYWAIATSALRDARNSRVVLSRIASHHAIKIDVISGEKEAKLILQAIRHLNLKKRNCIVMDLGGGSLEVLHSKNLKMKSYATLPLGAVRALSYYSESPEKLGSHIATVMEQNARTLSKFTQDRDESKLLIGTGGNIRALNKVANRIVRGKTQKNTLTRDQLCIVLDALSSVSLKQRQLYFGLPPDRADVILPAAQVFYEFMYYFGFKSIYCPKVSLKHGILAQLFQKSLSS